MQKIWKKNFSEFFSHFFFLSWTKLRPYFFYTLLKVLFDFHTKKPSFEFFSRIFKFFQLFIEEMLKFLIFCHFFSKIRRAFFQKSKVKRTFFQKSKVESKIFFKILLILKDECYNFSFLPIFKNSPKFLKCFFLKLKHSSFCLKTY